ncbi:toll-like receptor 6 [Agrilus planipennis]|uniref:Toll-like receptor 6 n=1 Tax=Agrilus planipennis TaxID=224129 RepID=A0A7F5R2A7_AGRPL|nr:toll-like receptor 6 [Agrilus planipennis]
MKKFYSLWILFLIIHIINFIPKGIHGNQECDYYPGSLPYCCDEYGDYYSSSSFTCHSIRNFPRELFVQYSSSYMHQSTNLLFLNSSLNKIPSLAFHTFSNLKRLYLNDTGTNTLEMGAFIGLTKLRELNLNHNNITEIAIGTLNHLLRLEILVLSNNNLENLNKDVFKDLGNLQRLYLNKNKLQILEEELFSSLVNATEIDLSQNNLNKLNPSEFHSLAELRLLNLSGNQIQSFPPSMFKGLTKLNILDLSKNSLTNIPYGILSGLTGIEYLSLSHNRLTAIDSKSLYSMQHLTDLNLSENGLTYLDAEELISIFTKLKRIHLSGNKWTCDTLFAILKAFRMTDAVVESGNNYQADNLHGIYCTPSALHSDESSMTISRNNVSTNLSSTIDRSQTQLYFQHLSNILTEISEKISKNNNLVGKVVEIVQINKMSKMAGVDNVTHLNISVLSNQYESDTTGHKLLLNLYNVLNRTYSADMIIEVKHLLEKILSNSERMVHLQESTHQQESLLNNENAPHTSYVDPTKTSTFMDKTNTFMRNISDNIAILHTTVRQLTAFHATNQLKSEFLSTGQTTASHAKESASTIIICLSVLVLVLFIILGVICFRNLKDNNHLLDSLRSFRSKSKHNKSEIDLMNSESVLNTQI